MHPAGALLALFLAPALLSAGQQAPDPALTRMAGCILQNHTYTCSKADLERALGLAKTIASISQPANHASDAALGDLIHHLGKLPATPDTPADLTFILEPLQEAGVQVGPGTVDLARLRVLLPAPTSGGPAKLLWVQTFNGDPSMSWPAIARATTLALREQLHAR